MKKVLLPLAALIMSNSLYAETSNEDNDAIIVTATRTAQTVNDSLASVTVISRDKIESSQSNNVLELLQSHSVGIDFTQSGGPGTQSSLFMRGTESDHTLVLIDGVRASSITTGAFNWGNLPAEQIERIEIVRGAQSALYGSDAIGGVIQIFTRKTSGPQVSFSGGSYNTWKGMIGTGGRIGEASYHLNVTQTDSEGFSATNPDSENDKDGYEARSITASLDSPIGNSAALSIQLFQGDNQVEFDAGSVGSYTDNTNRTVNAKLSWDTTDNWQQHFSLGSSTDHSETFSIWTDDITSRTRTLNWQNDLQLGEQSLLTVGAEQFKTTGENSGNFNKTVKNDALFAQYQTSLSAIDLNIGLREDDNGQYGTHATGHIGLGKALGSGRMFFNHGTAFKAPGFNNLYYPFFSNPDLKPEESTSSEIGYRQGKLQVSLFDTRIEQLIALDAFWIPQNIEKAKVQGLELEYGFILGEWDINTGLTLQDPKNETNDSQLLRRAKQKLFVNINGSVTEKLRSGITINHVGERDDVGGIKLNTYTLLNLTGSLQLSDEYSLNARIENLLDEEYELVSGYGTAGRSAYISLQYKP